MFKRVLPREHIEISGALMKIGNLFEKKGLFNRAMKCYHRGYNIAKNRMPIEHFGFRIHFKTIMGLYKKMNNINNAMEFSNENLILQSELFDEIRPNIAQIHLMTDDIIIDIEQKISRYYQALDIRKKCEPNERITVADCQSKIDLFS
ncbi:unnamed protein product [Rotaria sp. Silwood2]|nr:unnamed protein product [Rotaria sp. Silwood2]CAF3377150.1 unnamed protein product [Rotaria sp. Silwood2]CAF4112703.1 unnamed protein product [Rotaria sp. Silwood2]CAF4350533.1 unnamed protein product [Rotaria sp. Silwood2]